MLSPMAWAGTIAAIWQAPLRFRLFAPRTMPTPRRSGSKPGTGDRSGEPGHLRHCPGSSCSNRVAQGRTRPMGTTVVCAVILDDRLVLAHVGDSRAYRLRNGVLSCLTTDHDWVSEQIRLYGISREEAEKRAAARGARGALLRAVGVQEEVQADVLTLDWQADDVLLLCSDGLHGLVGDDAISRMLASLPAPLAVRALVDAANAPVVTITLRRSLCVARRREQRRQCGSAGNA